MGNWCTWKPPPPPVGAKALILVVGNDTEYKRRVAGALADALGATKDEPTAKAGVVVFRREAKEIPVVMDTVALKTAENWVPADIARLWISQNSLRKLSGMLVFVVCAIAPTDPVCQQPDVERNSVSWLSVLACIFAKHRHEIMFLSEDNTDDASRQKLSYVLKQHGFTKTENITFASVRKGIELALRHSVIRSIADDEKATQTSKSAMAPFRLPVVAPNASDYEKFGPWGPENVILFGRSGSGKSTLAQMLTLGRLDILHKKFSCSSSIRGETRSVNEGQGRGWRVIDTPGLGEPNDDAKSTVSTDKAARLILDHILLVEGTYCHFLYIWKKSRVEEIDTTLWKVFVKVVGLDRIKDHTSIVVSDADEEWLDVNISRLQESFQGCESFLTANFPPIPADDDEYEKDLQEMRLESLEALEEELASAGRIDTSCKLGTWSKGTQRSLMVRGVESAFIVRPAIRQSSAFGPSAAEEKHPSDYETARTYIRLNSVVSGMASVLLPSKKLDLRDESL